MSRPWTFALALASALVLTGPALADDGSIRIDVRGDDGGSVRIEVPSSWVRTFLSAADIACEPADDPTVRRAIRHLARRGDGASVRFVDRDGDRVHASRQGDVLRLDVYDPDDDAEAEIELPWRAAECWILGREPEGGVAIEGRESDFRFDLVSDDARIHVSID